MPDHTRAIWELAPQTATRLWPGRVSVRRTLDEFLMIPRADGW